MSVPDIAIELGSSSTTVYRWVGDIMISPEMQREILKNRPKHHHTEKIKKRISEAKKIQWQIGVYDGTFDHQHIDNDEKVCPQCKEKLPISFFYQRKSKGRYERHAGWCKKCFSKTVGERRIRYKKMAIEYLGGKCQHCGYNKNPAAMEFHHRDSKEKEDNINRLLRSSWKKVKSELDKCDLLCANCHRELHHPLSNA